ncbi:hypothetical protein GCM10023212_07200 [Luteolibacter yonseiensis]
MIVLRHPFTVACFLASLPATAAPVISNISPAAGASVSSLTSVQITFSESVGGVDATDIIVNGAIAQSFSGTGAGPYTFTFNQPQPGQVNIEFAGDTGIAGLSGSGTLETPPSWSYILADAQAPLQQTQLPTAGSTLGALTEAEVTFSEVVTGVDAADLRINNVAATSVTGFGAGPYVFTFSQPTAGTVNFTWNSGHEIKDLAENPFAAAGWNVTLSASGAGNLIINEFTAVNASNYLDADGDNEAWIEIHNPGPSAVNLNGWALTDDPDVPSKWVFPNRSLASGAYLVVFASEKNRRPVSGALHTNFKLGVNGGDLALVKPDRPVSFASNFSEYPAQRAGYSFGLSSGLGRYFTPPTPGAANSATVLSSTAVPPAFGIQRGFFSAPFALTLSTSTVDATIRYTTDGSEPTATTGTVYSGPINVSATTVLRAATFATGFVPSAPVTNTYIFQDQIINQSETPPGLPNNWGSHGNFPSGIVTADYGMDLDPLRVTPTNSASALDPVKVQRFNDGLRELPSVSIATANSNMFASTGMYHSTNVTNKEFPYKGCSVEMILPDGTTAFATTSGLGISGNSSRQPQNNPKHSFKLKFKPEFGPGKLEYKLFPETAVAEYDDIVLRAEYNTSWRHTQAAQRTRSTAIRDQWMKDSMLEMGNLASHSRLAHVFINGIYFGVYDLTEDPSSALGENVLGGQKEDYDVIDQGSVAEGTGNVYWAMTGLPAATSNSTYELFKGYLDMTSFIDYTALHFFAAHQDWGLNKNWVAIRQRAGGTFTTEGKFRYIPWDLENVLLTNNGNRVPAAGGSDDVPGNLHTKLDDNPQYRLDFADRIHRHMIAPGGALTQSKNVLRWQKWQAILDKPIVAESSRWGDYRRDVHSFSESPYELYTRESQWLAENTRMTGDYFPKRLAIFMGQLRTAGLYPTLNAPEIRNSGVAVGTRQVASGYQVSLAHPTAASGTTSAGTIYYTTDGTDPRVIYSGAVSTTALPYSTPLVVSSTTTIKARALDGSTWSALNEATFTTETGPPAVRITELMYHPSTTESHEFIEIYNASPRTVDLNGWYFAGVTYVFPPGSKIAPGSYMVIASNDTPADWRNKYTGVIPGAYYAGTLSNSGEIISLLDAAGNVVSSVNYKDKAPWPVTPDGEGYSLEVIDPAGDLNEPTNWKPSIALNGSPGIPNSAPPAPVINDQPQNQTVAQGGNITLSVGASGYGLSYQWFFGETEIPEARSSSYQIFPALPTNDGIYHCVVTNLGGSAISASVEVVVTQTYAQWIAYTTLTGPDAGINADPDHDGIVNLYEFYHHLNPTVADGGLSRLALFGLDAHPLPGNSTIRFAYRANRRAVPGGIGFERSTTLKNPWSTALPSPLETISTDPATGDPRIRAVFPLAPAEKSEFFRMRVEP